MAETFPFVMPSLGADMEVGTVLEWRIAAGDEVRPGDIVALVDTEKAEIEVESFDAGIVERITVEPGRQVPVGTVLAELRPVAVATRPAATAAAEPSGPPPPVALAHTAIPEVAASTATVAGSAPRPTPTGVLSHPAPRLVSPVLRRLAAAKHVNPAALPGTGVGGRITRADITGASGRTLSSPRARRLASVAGVDLSTIAGSGPRGAIVGADVVTAGAGRSPVAAVAAVAPGPPVGESPDRRARMRQAIASLMTRSWQEIPHYHVDTSIDLSATMAWLAATNAERPVAERLLPAAVLLRATAIAAAQHPAMNGWWQADTFRPAASVDLGVVVALRGGGLAVPTIPDAANTPLDAIMARLREVVLRARRQRLRSSDTTPASITVTNLGELGVERVSGLIHPPQVALVGFGSIHDEVRAIDGLIGVRPVVCCSLAGDHRASDGMAGAGFLSTIASLLQTPEAL